MINLNFDIDENDNVTHIVLDTHEYTGSERASTLKGALDDLKIQNPCTTFARKMNSGYYEASNMPEDTVTQIAEVTNYLSELWQFSDKRVRYPEGQDLEPYMNPLHILENALNLLIEQRNMIIDLNERYGS
ncbi:MAG: hypothetical protein K6E77_05545 [Lachnospiraceae bacterium]|nr:hypothetical protein [Lachnospiraceae bacterium]